MHSIPYRTKLRLRAALKITLICLAVLAALIILALIYLQRYVVYSEQGTYLDFSRSTAIPVSAPETETQSPTQPPSIKVIYGDPSTDDGSAAILSGYYIDTQMLQQPQTVLEALKALDAPCTVMIDLKNGRGEFYYSTAIDGAKIADVDISAIDAILTYLKANGFHMIARVQTFRDTGFALDHIDCSLAVSSGALWLDDTSNYWLDPGNATVLAYLKQIAKELASKGFREIVFENFYYPESTQIVYNYSQTRSDLIQHTAEELLNFFVSSNVTISFGSPSADFSLDNPASRVYVSDVDGSRVGSVVSSYSHLAQPEQQLVFLTSSRDTRFDGYSLLRPLS